MAENNEASDNLILVAQVKAYFLDGGAIDLLPFRHKEDVRSEINKFIEDWVKTGFLLKDNFLYPWHQVKTIEVASVQLVTEAQAKPYLDDWEQDSAAQKAFWKTRKPQAKEEGKKPDAPAH